jgi:serine phosphatase RsbU (regulator of sigma subunit)
MKTARLKPGDKMLFMTDGFLEAFDRRGLAVQKILQQLQDTPSGTAALADYLWQEFQEKTRNRNIGKDDATIIVAEYGG